MNDTRYRADVSIRISPLTEYPPGSGNWQHSNPGGLEIAERFDLTAANFMELAGILGRFHELAEKIKAERS